MPEDKRGQEGIGVVGHGTLEFNFETISDSEWCETELYKALWSNILAARSYFLHLKSRKDGSVNKLLIQPKATDCTLRDESDYYIPTIDWSRTGLFEERSQYEITIKIFYQSNVGSTFRSKYTGDAIHLVLKMLNVRDVDLVIASFPKMLSNQDEGGGTGELKNLLDQKSEDEEIKTWIALEELYEQKTVNKLGLEDFGCDKLARFLTRVKVRPKVNQINVSKCHNIDPKLLKLAKTEDIELLMHNDCSNFLPCISLGDLLSNGGKDTYILSEVNELVDDKDAKLSPLWVAKYTAVVKDRGVIENQGYFAVLAKSEDS